MSTRTTRSFSITDSETLQKQALRWANQYSHLTFFNNNDIAYPFGAFENRLAVGCAQELRVTNINGEDTFANLQAFHQQHQDWLVGYLSYDLKNEIEQLSSQNQDGLLFPLACFYQPIHLIDFLDNEVVIHSLEDPESIFQAIIGTPDTPELPPSLPLAIQASVVKSDYLQRVEAIRQHIIEGDVYELNYCIEFFAKEADIMPLQLYAQLNQLSPTPFSVYQRIDSFYLLCASPERFLQKKGSRLISQPIKGTTRRGKDEEEDQQLKEWLRNDEKELAENMMIVDLVRNDLARSALTGSVKVEEMFGIYSFRQVNQMISTVSAQIRASIPFTEAIRNAFPMGSMTGAPKIRAMELIEQYERTKRGLYSGAVGYISPNGDFDFNVVIRSMLYNARNRYLSFQVGSAITYDSVPAQEYEECLLKAKAMFEVLGAG
ncbi:MAG: anthranilate synthase component I family protein, partial [Bacteroidota bacterium]